MADFKDINLLAIGDTIQIAGAIYKGDGKVFLCFFPDDGGEIYSGEGQVCFQGPEDLGDRELAVESLQMSREEWTQFLRQTDIVEMEILTNASDDKFAKAVIRKSARQVSNHVTWAVYRRDGFQCRYCGRDDVPMTADHLVLYHEGGPWSEANLVCSCKKCNKKRGKTQYPEWLQSDYYKRVSKPEVADIGITPETHAANVALVETLDGIERMVHKATRRH